jgi:hypothetical protein
MLQFLHTIFVRKSIVMDFVLNLIAQNADVIITLACAAVIRWWEKRGLVEKYKKVIDELHEQLNTKKRGL